MFPTDDDEGTGVASFEITLLGKEPCAPDVVSYRFSRPEGYEFAAGQYGSVALTTTEGEQRHSFTHASAPGDDHLEVTTRLSGSAYKAALDSMEPGDTATLRGPFGALSLPRDVSRVCFLAGGVGITPVRSMLRDAVRRGRIFDDALLVYGNRDIGCIPYRQELEAMAPAGVRVVHVLEHPHPGWTGDAGYVTADIVRRELGEGDDRLFYVTGPPVMVTAMDRVLDELSIPQESRRIERFA